MPSPSTVLPCPLAPYQRTGMMQQEIVYNDSPQYEPASAPTYLPAPPTNTPEELEMNDGDATLVGVGEEPEMGYTTSSSTTAVSKAEETESVEWKGALLEHKGMKKKTGLPSKSAIWPSEGDLLRGTRHAIPGIHCPYAYQAVDTFGTPFAMQHEDFGLFSLNHLYAGEKIWTIIAPAHMEKLDEKLKSTSPGISGCAQFLRHAATYIPCPLLDEWGIQFRIIRQMPREVIITFPRAYHQGFSVGATPAEASNYTDKDWDIRETARNSDKPKTRPKTTWERSLEDEEGDEADDEEKPVEENHQRRTKRERGNHSI
ncbi:hypothetical protein H2199_008979 [Coniosporium tulheliwenetii]|uniref:Uncharacterized protein n=1 Tax=Coniosporium tulheliwenetii TaxID=3383036 RepID=A0ACC2YGR6_9PEZI|nr:hypothetical protein H2199_008979 [Cladosporium sp. JES 115]